MTESPRLKLKPWVSFKATEYGAILLDKKTSIYWELNEVASRVIDLFLRGADANDIAEEIHRDFEAPKREIREDIDQFMIEIRNSDFVDKRA